MRQGCLPLRADTGHRVEQLEPFLEKIKPLFLRLEFSVEKPEEKVRAQDDGSFFRFDVIDLSRGEALDVREQHHAALVIERSMFHRYSPVEEPIERKLLRFGIGAEDARFVEAVRYTGANDNWARPKVVGNLVGHAGQSGE